MTTDLVSAAFTVLLSDLRLTARQRQLATGRIRHLRAVFEAYELSRPPQAIGSFGRGTLIRRERDVDVMVVLAARTYVDRYRRDSRAFLYWLREALCATYPTTSVSTRKVALTMELGEGLGVDLVPVFDVSEVKSLSRLYRTLVPHPGDQGFYMPDGHRGWMKTNPLFHDELMRQADQRLGGKLRPLVRLMKLWNLHEHGRLQSFHLEMLVERVWREAAAMPSLPAAMAQTLRAVGQLADHRFHDPWPAGGWLDQHLDDRQRRSKVVRSLRADADRADQALALAARGDVAAALERWSVVFGHDFPTLA